MRQSIIIVMVLAAAFTSKQCFGDIDVFNSIPAGPVYNLPSLGYQANQTAEFGPEVNISGGAGQTLSSITVGMSDWARESDYETLGTSTGFFHPLTLNLYNAPSGTTPGSLFATETVNAFVPWRPENDPSVNNNNSWLAPDNNLYSGIFFTVNFNFSSLNVTLPTDFIVGLAYNTETWGANPIGVPGPYDSLNFALADQGSGEPTVGSLPQPNNEFWNTETAVDYTDGGAAGVGIFREDTNWSPYVPAIEINAVSAATPEPTSLAVWSVLGLISGGYCLRRGRKSAE